MRTEPGRLRRGRDEEKGEEMSNWNSEEDGSGWPVEMGGLRSLA